MDKNYAITVVNAETGELHSEIQLPILPRVSDNIAIGNTNYAVLNITIQADRIQILRPDPTKASILNPNAPQIPKEDKLIIPVFMVAKIIEIKEDPANPTS